MESLKLIPESAAAEFFPLLGPRLIFLKNLKALKADAGLVDEAPGEQITPSIVVSSN